MTAPTVPTVTDELIEELEHVAYGKDGDDVEVHGIRVGLVRALLAERADHLQQVAALKRDLADADAAHMMYAEQVVELNQQLAAAAITAENCDLFRKDAERMDIEAAAKKLAECMDYPWRFMPERGRNEMRAHAQAVIDAARTIADT